MGAAVINQTIFREELIKGLNAPSNIDQVYNIANSTFINEKQEFIEDIEKNQITKSLQAGAETPKTYEDPLMSYGNLYSFIGFDLQNSDPTVPVLNLLKDDIKLKRTSAGARYDSNKIKYEFPLQYPSTEELYNESPMPWGTSKSWLISVEEGLSNFNNYLFATFNGETKNFKNSRSTGGIQIKNSIERSEGYTPPTDGYIVKKLKQFINNFR